jgi:hypothetical protein
MLWLLVITFIGMNDPKYANGAMTTVDIFATKDACEFSKAEWKAPGQSTLECLEVHR